MIDNKIHKYKKNRTMIKLMISKLRKNKNKKFKDVYFNYNTGGVFNENNVLIGTGVSKNGVLTITYLK